MRTLLRLILGAILVAGLATRAAAQRRSFSMAHPGLPARVAIARVPGAVGSARGAAVRTSQTRLTAAQPVSGTLALSSVGLGTTPIVTTAIGGFVPVSVSQLLNPVPGLGFDFSHLAAVNENLDLRALVDPVTQQRLALAERLLRETPVVPVVFPAFASSPVVVLESPPPVVVIQQPAAAQTSAEVQAPAPAAAPAPPPLPTGALLLVRRDGSRVRVVAFAQEGNQIVYITDEGERHLIALVDLDIDATRRANEAKGTFLRFSL